MRKLLLLFLSFSIVFSACNDDDEGDQPKEEYSVLITFMSITEDAEFEAGKPFHVHINFNRDNEAVIHNVKLELIDGSDNLIDVLHEKHEHAEGEFQFHADLTIEDVGSYKFRASTTDHDMEQEVTAERAFKIIN